MVDPDKESHEVTPAKISEKEAEALAELLKKKNVNIDKTLAMYKVARFVDLTPAQYANILEKLNGV
jgi:hypothetical protein